MPILPGAKTHTISFPHQDGGTDENIRTDVGDEIAAILEKYLRGELEVLPSGYIPHIGGWLVVTKTFDHGRLSQFTKLILVYTLNSDSSS